MFELFKLNESMGNIRGQPLKLAICFNKEEKTNLEDFLNSFDMNEEHHFVILEGDCILVRIFRLDTLNRDSFIFAIYWYHISENGHLKYCSSGPMNTEDCLWFFKKHISPYGVLTIEDSEKKFDEIISNSSFINRKNLVNEMRSSMKSGLNRNFKLESLAKKTVRDYCVELDTLPLPRRMIDYLKE